jgi:hypothetical protein
MQRCTVPRCDINAACLCGSSLSGIADNGRHGGTALVHSRLLQHCDAQRFRPPWPRSIHGSEGAGTAEAVCDQHSSGRKLAAAAKRAR